MVQSKSNILNCPAVGLIPTEEQGFFLAGEPDINLEVFQIEQNVRVLAV